MNSNYNHSWLPDHELQPMTVEKLKNQRTSLLHDFLHDHVVYNTLFNEIYDQEWFWNWRYHKYDVLNHTRWVVRNFMVQYQELNLLFAWKLALYFDNEIDGLSKLVLTQLWLVFHDAWKQSIFKENWTMRGHAAYTVQFQLDEIGKRFGLLESHKTYLQHIILHHDTPLEDDTNIATRKILKSNDVYLEWLLISLADIMSCEWEEMNPEWIENRRNFVIAELEKHIHETEM